MGTTTDVDGPARAESSVVDPYAGRLQGALKGWREELIGQTKRERLLYWRPSRTSTLEIHQPALNEVFRRLSDSSWAWGFFVPPEPGAPLEETRRQPGERELVTDKADPAALQVALRGLDRRATRTVMDTGLWVLYLGFGMLRWRVPNDPDEAHSPLLLVPVLLDRDSPRQPFHMRRAEGDPVLNPVLAVKLQNEFGVALPALDDPDETHPDQVLARVR